MSQSLLKMEDSKYGETRIDELSSGKEIKRQLIRAMKEVRKFLNNSNFLIFQNENIFIKTFGQIFLLPPPRKSKSKFRINYFWILKM